MDPSRSQIYLAQLVLEIQTLVVFTLVSQLVPSKYHIDCHWRDPADDYWSTSGPSEMNQYALEDLGFSEEQTQVCCGFRARGECKLWALPSLLVGYDYGKPLGDGPGLRGYSGW